MNPFRGFREQLSISTDQVTHLSHSLRRVAGLWRNTFPFFSDSFRNREGMKNTIGMCMHQGHKKWYYWTKFFNVILKYLRCFDSELLFVVFCRKSVKEISQAETPASNLRPPGPPKNFLRPLKKTTLAETRFYKSQRKGS